MGPYIVILSSTIHGYEGTGRSLSVKLFHELKYKGVPGHGFKESILNEPIRYGKDDPIEKWLYDLLCLDATDVLPLNQGLPHPTACNLYYINRDTLFSGHPLSEQFLKKVWSLFVSSHYKNSPNDLQLLSDAPAHCILLLSTPNLEKDKKIEGLPDILCAVQCAVEGGMAGSHILQQLGRGNRPSGDLVPWTICEQFQDSNFGELTGVRIVRIATHPDAQGMGYGSRALELLQKYYEGALINVDEIEEDEALGKKKPALAAKEKVEENKLRTEEIKPKKGLQPIMQSLSKRKPLPVHYLSTSYGITPQLFNFWKKSGFSSLYIRQTLNELTGEHTCVMLKPILSQAAKEITIPKFLQASSEGEDSWIAGYVKDFKKRFINLLGYEFRSFPTALAMSILNVSKNTQTGETADVPMIEFKEKDRAEIECSVTVSDVTRLESYTKNLVDYHMIIDLLPSISRLYFLGQLKKVGFSYIQLAMLVGVGLQYKKIEEVGEEINVATNQLMAMFNKAMRKICKAIREVYERDIEKKEEKKDKVAEEAFDKKHELKESEPKGSSPQKKKKVEDKPQE